MSFYFIGNPDAGNSHRWTYNTSVTSTKAILKALRKAGFDVVQLKSTESVSPYLDELDISKPRGTREQLEQICAAADPAPKGGRPPAARVSPKRFRI
jgi:hypothetical protein